MLNAGLSSGRLFSEGPGRHPWFVQGGSSTRQEVRRLSPDRVLVSSKALAALGAPRSNSPVRASEDSPARTQAPHAGSSYHKERTTQTVNPSPRQTRPTVTASGPTRSGPPTPPVPLCQVLNLDSEEQMYCSSEDELEHRARDGSLHSQRSGERDPPAEVDEESSVGRDQRLTLTEVKAWSFGKLEVLTRPSFSGGLVKLSLSQLASGVSMEPQPAFDKFPNRRWHCWGRIGRSKA